MNQSEQHQQFVDLLVEHQNQLFAYLFAMVHSRDDAEDLYQQTSLVLWQKFDKFESGSNFFRWAARTAQLEALNFLKYRRRSKLQFSSEVTEQLADAAEAASQQESDRTDALLACMDKLNPEDRHLVLECYKSGSKLGWAIEYFLSSA